MGIKRKAPRQIARSKKRVARGGRRGSLSRSVVTRQVHTFRCNFSQGVVTGNVAYTPYQGVSLIQLSQVINATEFANLYDQYKIVKAEMSWYLRVDPSAQAAASAIYPRLFICRDYDSSTLMSQSEMRERSNVIMRVITPNRPVKYTFKPNVLTETYRGVGTTTYAPKFNQWIDMANQDATHYGILWNIDDFSNTNYKLEVEVALTFQCKNTR